MFFYELYGVAPDERSRNPVVRLRLRDSQPVRCSAPHGRTGPEMTLRMAISENNVLQFMGHVRNILIGF